MEFKLIQSGREKIQMLDQGFRLKHNKGPQGPLKTSYFVCVEPGCKARAATVGELTLTDLSLKYHHVEQHTHHSDPAKNIVSEQLYKFRENAKTNPDKTAKSVYEKIVADTINSVDTPEKAELAQKMPKFHVIKDQHYRQRQKQRPKLPHSLAEVDIQSYGNLTTTERGYDFYRGKTPSTCVELFMSPVQIDIAIESSTLFLDGTFAITPEPFYQTVILRGKVGNNCYTIGTALLPNKRETTYKELLQKMVDVVKDGTGKTLNFEYVHSDCEQGILNAVRAIFPDAEIKLCRFHILDAVRRNFNSIGLRSQLKHMGDLRRFYARVKQILFFPPPLWPRIWKILVAFLTQELRDNPLIQKFLDYLVSIPID